MSLALAKFKQRPNCLLWWTILFINFWSTSGVVFPSALELFADAGCFVNNFVMWRTIECFAVVNKVSINIEIGISASLCQYMNGKYRVFPNDKIVTEILDLRNRPRIHSCIASCITSRASGLASFQALQSTAATVTCGPPPQFAYCRQRRLLTYYSHRASDAALVGMYQSA